MTNPTEEDCKRAQDTANLQDARVYLYFDENSETWEATPDPDRVPYWQRPPYQEPITIDPENLYRVTLTLEHDPNDKDFMPPRTITYAGIRGKTATHAAGRAAQKYTGTGEITEITATLTRKY